MRDDNTHLIRIKRRYAFLGFCISISLISGCSILRTDGSMSFNGEHAGMIYFNTTNRIKIIDSLVANFGEYDTTKYKNQIVWIGIKQREWSDTLMDMKVLWSRDYGKDFESLAIAVVDYNGVVITERKTDKVKIVKKYINGIRK